jgi:hypothetical protein
MLSFSILVESFIILEESIDILDESADILLESLERAALESAAFVSELAPLLHAAKAPIANTNNNFFIVMNLCVN